MTTKYAIIYQTRELRVSGVKAGTWMVLPALGWPVRYIPGMLIQADLIAAFHTLEGATRHAAAHSRSMPFVDAHGNFSIIEVEEHPIAKLFILGGSAGVESKQKAHSPKVNDYVVIFESDEVISHDPEDEPDTVITGAGDQFVACEDICHRRFHRFMRDIPKTAMVFASEADAENWIRGFLKNPKSHYYIKPTGKYSIVPVKPHYEMRLKGYVPITKS